VNFSNTAMERDAGMARVEEELTIGCVMEELL
jgi:hypothetical protein